MISAIAIILYTLLVGANPAVVRAAILGMLTLLSVVAGDKTGLPSPEILEALKGYNLLRTDVNGWIKISTDAEKMWVEVERE